MKTTAGLGITIVKLATACMMSLLVAGWAGRGHDAEAGSWQIIGPGGGGQITSITEDPSDPDHLYLSINAGGARKSSDAGRTWQIINRGFDYEKLGKLAQKLAHIVVHPGDSSLLLAAGLNGCIYHSTNGGLQWELSYEHPSNETAEIRYHFSRFLFDPGDPDTVYIGVGSIQRLILGVGARKTGDYWPKIDMGPTILRGVWTDGTWEWQAVGSIEGKARGCDETGCGRYLNIYSMGIPANKPDRLFCVTERGVYKGRIEDNGRIESFKRVKKGLPKSKHIHGGRIVFDRNNPQVAYLSILNLKNKRINRGKDAAGGIFRSVNGGKSWSKLTKGLDDNSNYFDIQIDPASSETIYVAQFFMKVKGEWIGGNIYKSENSGDQWQDLVQHVYINIDAGWQQADVDKKKKFGVHFISASKNDAVLWNRGGILCESDDLAKRYPQWTNLLTERVAGVGGDDEWKTTGSEQIALAHSIAIDPQDSETIYLPYGDHNYFKSTDGGNQLKIIIDSREMKDAGNGYDSGTLLVDETQGQKVYAATQGPHQKLEDGGVAYSADGGENWVTIGWHLKNYSRQEKSMRGAKTDLAIEYVDESRRNLYAANYGNTTSLSETQGGVYLLEDFDGRIDPDSIDFWNAHWKRIFPVAEGEYKHGTYKLAPGEGFDTLFVGVNDTEQNAEHGLYKLTRTEGEWSSSRISGPPSFEYSKAFNDLETGPDSGNIYIATDRGLFVFDKLVEDITELQISQFEALKLKGIDPDVTAVEIYANNEDIIYVASPKTEILRTDDRGQTPQWEEISKDIPTLGFIVLKVDPNQDVIYASSPAAGIWKRF